MMCQIHSAAGLWTIFSQPVGISTSFFADGAFSSFDGSVGMVGLNAFGAIVTAAIDS